MNRIVAKGYVVNDWKSFSNDVYKNRISIKNDVNGKDNLFITIIAFKKTGELASKYANKGTNIIVDGRLSPNNWTDKEGNKHYDIEIIVDKIEWLYTKNNKQKNEQDVPF